MSEINMTAMTATQAANKLAELAIRLDPRYTHLQIVEGSLIQEKDHPYFSNKKRVKVICPGCGVHVERATSDLFTFKGCPTCKKDVSKAEKAVKKAGGGGLTETAMLAKIAELEAKLAAQQPS